jgi:alpha-beta hydrolase superfamily lysophospholipase
MGEAFTLSMNLVLREQVTLQCAGVTLSGSLFLPTSSASPCPAIVVCHGAGDYKENYTELCEYLGGKGIGSLALDMHGHGASGGNRTYVEMRHWCADVRAGLDFLAQDKRVDPNGLGAFGPSSGGTAILEAALEDSRLKALVALDATVRNSLPAPISAFLKCLVVAGRIKRFFTGSDLRVNMLKLNAGMRFAVDDEVNAKLLADEAIKAALESFPFPGAAESFFVNTIERAGHIAAPTLVIWGAEDQIDPPETGQLLFEALTCKKSLQIIEGNGHGGHMDQHREKVFELTAHWFSENLAASIEHVSESEAACRAG